MVGEMLQPKVIYVLEKTELAGGVKVVFEHVNRLNAMGIPTEIYSLQKEPSWFRCQFKITSFTDYSDLGVHLALEHAIKVGTLWRTAPIVATNGQKDKSFYLVQDIETSYYTDEKTQRDVINTYSLPLTKLVESRWVEKQLKKGGLKSKWIGIGIDHSIFHEDTSIAREENLVLVNAPRYRRHWQIKGMDTLSQAISIISRRLPNVRFASFSTESKPLSIHGVHFEHFSYLKDSEIANLFRVASCFLLTSLHEGFCLPALEAMACGCPLVITRADGNEEFCRDRGNCLLTTRDVTQIAETVIEVLRNKVLAKELILAGVDTAKAYNWDRVVENLIETYKL